MSEFDDVLKKLSHPGTVKLLQILKEGEKMSFSELMFKAQLNPSTLSTILKILTESGILKKDGQSYLITEKGYKIADILEELIDSLK